MLWRPENAVQNQQGYRTWHSQAMILMLSAAQPQPLHNTPSKLHGESSISSFPSVYCAWLDPASAATCSQKKPEAWSLACQNQHRTMPKRVLGLLGRPKPAALPSFRSVAGSPWRPSKKHHASSKKVCSWRASLHKRLRGGVLPSCGS